MYSKEELHKLISGAIQGFLPGEGVVYTVTMTPMQREALLETLKPSLVVPMRVNADGTEFTA